MNKEACGSPKESGLGLCNPMSRSASCNASGKDEIWSGCSGKIAEHNNSTRRDSLQVDVLFTGSTLTRA